MNDIKKKKRRVLITGSFICKEAMDIFKDNNIEVYFADDYSSHEKILEMVNNLQPDGIIVRKGNINKEIISSSDNIKVIVKHGTGYNNIDVDTASEYKIPVLITPKANMESVAEHVLALMYALTKKILLHHLEMTKNNIWNREKHQSEELYNKTIGIIGLGRIGSRIAELLKPLYMNILVYDPYVSDRDLPENVKKVDNLEELLKNSDIVSINCPLNKNTYHLLGEKELTLMKSSSYLINTSRGGIIDEEALIKVLEKNLIAGAGIDVFEKEPPIFTSKLFNLNNIIVTPHTAGPTKEAFVRMGKSAAEKVILVLDKKIDSIEKEAFINFVDIYKK